MTVTSTSGCQQGGNLPGGGPGNGRSFTPPEGGFSGTPPTTGTFNGTPPPGGFGAGGGNGTFRGGLGGGAFGTIASVSASSFTVESSFGGTDVKTTVKTTSKTTYDVTDSVTASEVAKGSCITAIGANDVSGVLQARTVSISSPVDGECQAPAATFGGGPGFGGGGFGGAPPANPEGGAGGA